MNELHHPDLEDDWFAASDEEVINQLDWLVDNTPVGVAVCVSSNLFYRTLLMGVDTMECLVGYPQENKQIIFIKGRPIYRREDSGS